MLEEVIFGPVTMPGEIFRLLIAFAGTAVAAYYDIFNKRNVPDNYLYAFLAVAFLINVVFYEEDLFLFSMAVALFISGIAYVFYRVGQIGGADVFVMASIMLLLPIQPSFVQIPFNIPFFFPVWLFSGIALALYVMISMGYKLIQTEAKPDWKYALMFIPYLLFAYVFINSMLFSIVYFAFVSIALFTTIFFMMFKQDLNRMLAEEMPVGQLEAEDVLALEMMDQEVVKKNNINRLMTKDEISRLKDLKIEDVWVFTKLPPFLPFILLGMVLAMFFSGLLFLM
ncbi:MAG: prepilin peptidase [Candidatus Micrarchaeota archaeon]